MRLHDLAQAGPALLAFFKISCPVCQFTFPFLERIHQGLMEQRLRVYAVSQNDAEDTEAFNRRFGVTFPTLLDPEDENFPASNAYGISSVPTMILVETNGTISRALEGFNRRELLSLGAIAGVNLFREGENVPDWKAG